MAALNRYDQPAQSQFINTYVPIPFQALAQAGMARQQRHDQALEQELEFDPTAGPSLSYITTPMGETLEVGDRARVEETQQEFENRLQQLSSLAGTSDRGDPRYQRELRSLYRDLAKAKSPTGVYGRAAANVERNKQIQELIAENPDVQRAPWLANQLEAQVRGFAGASMAGQGIVDFQAPAGIGEYVDPVEAIDETIDGIESMLTQLYSGTTGTGYIKEGRREEVTRTKIENAVDAYLNTDNKLTSYLASKEQYLKNFTDTPEEDIEEAIEAEKHNLKELMVQKYQMSKGMASTKVDSNFGRILDANSKMIHVNTGQGVKVPLQDYKDLQKERSKLEAQLLKTPKSNQGTIKDKIDNLDSTITAIQDSFKDSPYYKELDYSKEYGKYKDHGGTLSKDAFEEKVLNMTDEDLTKLNLSVLNPMLGTMNYNEATDQEKKEAKQNQQLLNAYNAAQSKFDKYIDRVEVAADAPVLSGEDGTRTQAYNDEYTKSWKERTTGYTTPFSTRQVHEYISDKYKKEDVDQSRTKVSISGFVQEGKVHQQLKLFNKDGDHIGTEWIAPSNQFVARSQTIQAAKEMMNNFDPAIRQEGYEVYSRAKYLPVIQANANLRNRAKGNLGLKYQKDNVKFKLQEGSDLDNPVYLLYTGTDDNPDYFRDAATGERYQFGGEEQIASFFTSLEMQEGDSQ